MGSAAWIGGAEALRAVIPGVTTTAATGPRRGKTTLLQRDIFGKVAGTCPFARISWVFGGFGPFWAHRSKGTVF